jgi:hypothetical protein
MANYILVTSDAKDVDGASRSAREIATKRMDERRWPIYRRTRFRADFVVDDRLVIYLGGHKIDANSFVATSRLLGVTPVGSSQASQSFDLQRQRQVSIWLEIATPLELTPPVPVRALLSKLSFLPVNPKSWGVAFMGGARQISDADWNLITLR